MSFLAGLDATSICARRSAQLVDAAWALPIPVVVRPTLPTAPFSWRSLARNPQALAFSAMVASAVTRDALLRNLMPARRPTS